MERCLLPCNLRWSIRFVALCVAQLVAISSSGCGYHFSGYPATTPFGPNLKTIEIRSAVNNSTVTGIETELTNALREEFALGARLTPVRSNGDLILSTLITAYEDSPASYKADGKELTRIGTLRLSCRLNKPNEKEPIWKNSPSASLTYLVANSASGTIANRRQAISKMIEDLIQRIHHSLYDNF